MESLLAHFVPDPHDTFHILLILMVVIWTSGRVLKQCGLPLIFGEILAGMLLGPQMLGIVTETEVLKVFAELGAFFMMFHAGLDTNLQDFLRHARPAFFASVGGISVITILIGFLFSFLGLATLPAIFSGLVLSACSFPVIVRSLKHFKLKTSKIGDLVIGTTVFTEILTFLLISILISTFAAPQLTWEVFGWNLVKAFVFVFGTLYLGTFILPYFRKYLNRVGFKAFTFSLIVGLVFGLFAEAIGFHIILGAYLAGMFVREEIENSHLMTKIEDRYFAISYSFLGPIFFAVVGLNISLDVFSSSLSLLLLLCGMVLVGQFVGSGLVGLIHQNLSFRQAAIFSTALTGRGVADIVLASIGHQAGIINTKVFSLLIATTILMMFASPLLLHKMEAQKA